MLLFAALPIFASCGVAAQSPVQTVKERISFTKCWAIPASIDPSAGLSADQSAGYFADSGGKVTAVELKSGNIEWSSEVGGAVLSNILVTDRSVFVAAKTGTDAVLRSLSLETGLPGWTVPLPVSERFEIRRGEGTIFVIAFSGEIIAISEADGSVKWKNAIAERLRSAYVGDDAVIILGESGRSKILSPLDGSEQGQIALSSKDLSISIRGRSNILVTDERGSLTSLDPAGRRNWRFKSGGRIGFLRLIDDKALVGSADNFVYQIDTDRGNVIWKRRLPGRVANGGLINDEQAVFSVIGERTAYILDIKNGRVVDLLALTGEDSFLFTPIRANGAYLLAGTSNGIAAFSRGCAETKKATN